METMAKSKQHYLIFTSGYWEELHFGGVHTVATRISEILSNYWKVTVITEGKNEEIIIENKIEIRKWLNFENMENDFLSLIKTGNFNKIFFTDFRRAHFLLEHENIINYLKEKMFK